MLSSREMRQLALALFQQSFKDPFTASPLLPLPQVIALLTAYTEDPPTVEFNEDFSTMTIAGLK
jgi:hypothetical protein